jgi:asparagine N-glycosylation enzyme membrane subunit Stt3
MVYAMLWVWVIFFLCRDIFDSDKAGLLGMALAAFNPYSVRMACQILREPLYILLFTMSLWCTVRLIKSEKVNFFYPAFIGVMTILGFYTRFEGVEIALFVPLAAIILCKKQCFHQAAANFTIYFLTITLLAAGLLYAGDSYMQKIPGKISWVSEVNNK